MIHFSFVLFQIHTAVLRLMAKFSFYKEKNFGQLFLFEIIGYFTTVFPSFISTPVRLVLQQVIIPTLLHEEGNI